MIVRAVVAANYTSSESVLSRSCSYRYDIVTFPFSPFPPLPLGAAFSVLAISMHPCHLVPRFPFSPFPPLPLGVAFSVLAFSVLAFSASPSK